MELAIRRAAVAAMHDWRDELAQPGALLAAPRFQIESCAQALWNEIMLNDDVPAEVVLVYEMLKTELRLRAQARRMH